MKHIIMICLFFVTTFVPMFGQLTGPGGDPDPVAIQERLFTGAAAGDEYGASVASAGDINGDGYDDIIIGAHFHDPGGLINAGRAYIYFGGPNMDNIADVILSGIAAGDRFGRSVSSAGDVNGDGYCDVIVGAFANDGGGSDAGRAYIFFGGVYMDNFYDVVLTGAAANDWFGWSVSTAGDVNGDGYSDVIVGAYSNDAGGTDAGRAYICFGGAEMNNVADVTLTGSAALDFFGYSVSTAGDVNGDGYGDVIVGAYGNDAAGNQAGRAYIYFGGATVDNTADVTLTGVAAGDSFGWSVSAAGDFNGDGYSDVIVGALFNDAAGPDAGAAFIYFGDVNMDSNADASMSSPTFGAPSDERFGHSVAGAGDVNGDGFDDVVVGAVHNDAGGANAGRAYIYYGGLSNPFPFVIFTGAAAGDLFGASVSAAGDVNDDGYDDVLVGAYNNDAGGTNAGRAYLYLNSLTGIDIPDKFFTGGATGDQLGQSVASAGDFNGDGYDDMIIGATGVDSVAINAGRAYIYFGSPFDGWPPVILSGEGTGDQFGYSVASAGDVNGDGYDDVIVGAPYSNVGGQDAGRAYVFFGGITMDNTPDVIMTGSGASDLFGSSVSGAGDVNGDGYSDVIVGAYLNDRRGINSGSAYIFFGGANMNNVADVIVSGTAGKRLGISVAAAGDINGDGYRDVIAGVIEENNFTGTANIYFGGAIVDTIPDAILTQGVVGDYFGFSVASAGDLNGDAYDDVVVGAYAGGTGGPFVGKVYVYFGAGTRAEIEIDDIVITGGTGEGFGYSVSGAGDVNADGYADVIVGAYGVGTSPGPGHAYIYFGGADMNNDADMFLTGAANGDQFGFTVAGAGDVNFDGYSDVLVGAPFNNAGGSNAGRAYLYLSSSPPIVPRITSVRDVPFDQGGYVTLRWRRSAYDERNISRVTHYIIERSEPPGIGGFVWEGVGTSPATHNVQYAFTVRTLYDSMPGTNGTFFFRVTAVTSNANEYWRSNIVSGHSVDNLVPLMPQNPVLVSLGGGSSRLSWNHNRADPDVGGYSIYRSTVDGFPIADSTRLTFTSDSTLIDTPPTSDRYFYRITTRDIHGNESSPTAQLSSVVTVATTINAGWNLISNPVVRATTEDSVRQLFPNSSFPYVFGFNPISGYYQTHTMPNGVGFWGKFPAAGGNMISGAPVTVDTLGVQTGWNLVGSISEVVPVNEITSIPPGIVTSQFFAFQNGYVPTDSIHPGRAYWVKVSQIGSLVLSSGSPGPVANRIRIVPTGELPPAPPEGLASEFQIPYRFVLEQNYPNPFNPTTVIHYTLPSTEFVSLKVYDMLGQEVSVLVHEVKQPGIHVAVFDGSGLPSGVYLYRLQSGRYSQTKKLILLK